MHFKKTILQSKSINHLSTQSDSLTQSKSKIPFLIFSLPLRLTQVWWYAMKFRALSRILTLRVSFVAFYL